MGVMLALSAIFAVVISTISMPGDRATAQVADVDDAVTARAKAWFNTLTLDEAINAILGAETDAVADVDGEADTQGRQYVDDDDPAANDLPIEFIKKAWDDKSDTQSFYDGLPADTTAEATSGTANKAGVNALVDGSADASSVDIYAVGEHNTDITKAIRGFQSVELWWGHLTCTEARIAVGEDNNDYDPDGADDDLSATDDNDATSAVCDANLNDAGDAVTSVSLKAYDDVKATADKFGQVILGLSSAGDADDTDARAEQWWDALTSAERPIALYGAGTTATAPTAADTGDATVTADRALIASQDYGDITTALTFTVDVSGTATALPLNDDSKALVPQVKELINDRWKWIYAMGGSNDMGTSELVYWWDSLGDMDDAAAGSAQRRIAVGVDNEPQAAPDGTFDAAGYSVDWNDLNPLTDGVGTAAGKALEEQVFKVGRAILFRDPDPLPDVAAWWNTLNADQMVNVVYGSPLLDEDADSDATTARTLVVHVNDRKMFQVPYDMLTGHVIYEDLHPATTALLTRHGTAAAPGFDADESGTIDTTTYDHDSDDTTDAVAETAVISTKLIVDTIAAELFDPPTQLPGTTRVTVAAARTLNAGTEADDADFDWPYNSMNKASNVGDWWETTDCRVMRLAVGEDNDYFHTEITRDKHPTVDDDTDTADVDESQEVIPAETNENGYCAHFPGHDENDMNDLSEEAQKRVVEVGAALLGLTATDNALHAGRPSFNDAATGDPVINGTAQVGSTLTVDTSNIEDDDGIPEDSDGDKEFMYQWLRDGTPISDATGSSYVLTADDSGKRISIRVTFTDDERYPEERTSPPSLATSPIASSPGEIRRIEPAIRSVVVSAGEEVQLAVDVYGLQNVKDNKLSATFEWTQTSGSNTEDLDDTAREITYTAPSSPGTYTITAKLDDGQCQPATEAKRDDDCSASITVQVRRPAPPVAEDEAPVNPPGEIPGILTDSDGNQYEVFTPVEGGTFDGGEGYSIHVPSGAVPNGEFIGIRVSDDGAASNFGMTHQRYTLGGNMYGVHAVDGSGAAISSYQLEDPARVCVPLPDELSTRISDLALVGINSDGSLTIHAANVRIGDNGTQVCGNVSGIPTSVAVGSQGAPAAPPTETPPDEVLPATGATAPASNGALIALFAGLTLAIIGTTTALTRRRRSQDR